MMKPTDNPQPPDGYDSWIEFCIDSETHWRNRQAARAELAELRKDREAVEALENSFLWTPQETDGQYELTLTIEYKHFDENNPSLADAILSAAKAAEEKQ